MNPLAIIIIIKGSIETSKPFKELTIY